MMIEKPTSLNKLIKVLQKKVAEGSLTAEVVSSAIKSLNALGYKYNDGTFPRLVNTESFKSNIGDSPTNLAEALLWKLGKWKSYKKFVLQYEDNNSKPSNSDVVFFAFAKHLKNQNNPIYDQHAIRAMWAICSNMEANEKEKCKNLLMNKKNEWKDSGSGGNAVNCYNIFTKHLAILTANGATNRDVDLLLMPLGQAIKRQTVNLTDFQELCSPSIV